MEVGELKLAASRPHGLGPGERARRLVDRAVALLAFTLAGIQGSCAPSVREVVADDGSGPVSSASPLSPGSLRSPGSEPLGTSPSSDRLSPEERLALLEQARELLARSAVRVGYESTDRNLVRQALQLLEPAGRAHPQDVELRYWTGYALFCDDRGEEARVHLEAAVAVDPEHFDALQVLGTLAMHAGAADEARGWFERAVALRSEDANAKYLLGKCLEEVGELRRAEEAYREALALHPGFIEPYNRLGCLLMRAGREREAERMLRAFCWWKAHKVALRDRPRDAGASGAAAGDMSGPRGAPSLSLLQRRLTALAEAADRADDAVETKTDLTLILARARVAIASGDHDDARGFLRQARRAARADADVLCDVGRQWRALADPERAGALHAAALRADPQHVETLVELARALDAKGRPGAARRRWQDVLRVAPACAEASHALDVVAEE